MKEQINYAHEMKIPCPVQVENGDIVKIYPGNKPHVYDKAPSGRLCVDGDISIEEDSVFIKERKNLANNGFIDLTLIVSNKGALGSKPLLNVKGLPIFEKEELKSKENWIGAAHDRIWLISIEILIDNEKNLIENERNSIDNERNLIDDEGNINENERMMVQEYSIRIIKK